MKYNKEWEQYVATANLKDALEERMDVIGQNGNDGLHYETPEHYNFDIQPWDYMESLFSDEAFAGFLEGNVIKYVSRWRDKSGVEDLRKASTYLNKLIEFTEGE